MNTRMQKTRLNIGAYILRPYARSEAHIKDVADCGIDFMTSIPYDIHTMDLFHKYGIGAVVNGVLPAWWGGDGSKAGQLEALHPIDEYEAAAKTFVDHPAIWGIDIGDEPSALDFPYYGKIFDKVNTLFKNQFPYINLYPNYASVAQNNAEQTVNQLGTATYDEHIAKYCELIPSDYLCYDFYLYSLSPSQHYENLITVTDACKKTGRSMWIVLQVNSQDASKWISTNNLRFQAFTSMAFGAESIIWACYTAGWWHNQVLDNLGNKTEQYEKLKTVNHEIHTIADEYMKYKNTDTHFVGFDGNPDMQRVCKNSLSALSTADFTELRAEDNRALLVGEMTSRSNDGKTALMICAADDPQDKASTRRKVVFTVREGRVPRAVSGMGEVEIIKEQDGSYSFPIGSNEGVLLVAQDN